MEKFKQENVLNVLKQHWQSISLSMLILALFVSLSMAMPIPEPANYPTNIWNDIGMVLLPCLMFYCPFLVGYRLAKTRYYHE